MANVISRVSQKRLHVRHYFGELDADTLVTWLNQRRKTISHRRIERLLVNLQAALDEFPDFTWTETASGLTATARVRRTRSLKAAQEELARYRFRPALRALAVRPDSHGSSLRHHLPAASSSHPVHVELPTAPRRLPARPARPDKAVGTYEPAFEWDCEHEAGQAIIAIMELGRAGLLWRVRRCKCGEWLYARFRHQRFCSDACKQAAQKSGPRWREYRRKYMQRYREKESASLHYEKSRRKRGG